MERGSTVTIHSRKPGIRVTASGKALQPGAVGEVITIEMPDSKQRVMARVVGPQLVEVAASSTREHESLTKTSFINNRMTPYDSLIHDLGRLPRRALLRGAVCTSLSLGIGSLGLGQDVPNSSLFSGRMTPAARLARQPGNSEVLPPPATTPAPDELVRSAAAAAEGSRKSTTSSRFASIRALAYRTSAQLQSRRTAQYDARLNDWVILEGLRAIKPAPQSDGDQRIQGNLNQLDRVTGQLDTTESLKFDIAATVAAVLPNGNIVLEAHRSIRNNNEQWMHSLSGVCRREDIGPGQHRPQQRHRQPASREARARPDSRLLQTRLADSLVRSVRAVLNSSFKFQVQSLKVQTFIVSVMRRFTRTTVIVVSGLLLALSRPRRPPHRRHLPHQGSGRKHRCTAWASSSGSRAPATATCTHTQRALAHYMELLGHRVGTNQTGQPMFEELKNVKNVALVYVTATVPPAALSRATFSIARSAPRRQKPRWRRPDADRAVWSRSQATKVYGLAKGQISLDDPARPQSGRIALGCQLEKKSREPVRQGRQADRSS